MLLLANKYFGMMPGSYIFFFFKEYSHLIMSGIPVQAPTNPPPGTAAILSTLAVGLLVGVAGFIVFSIGRRWIRRFYV